MEDASNLEFKRVLNDIKSGKLLSIYLIQGDDNFLIKEGTTELVNAILPNQDQSLNLEFIDGSLEDWDKIIESLNTLALFGKSRVIVVKDTKIFLSKFVVRDVIEESKEEFEADNLDEAARLYRIVLGHEGFKTIDEITSTKIEKLPGYENYPKAEDWLKAVLEACRNQDLNPIPYEDNSEKLLSLLKKEEKEGIPDQNVLVLATRYVDKRKRLYKAIEEKGIIIDFSIQRTRRDPAEIENEEKKILLKQANALLKNRDKSFSRGAFDTLANKTGYNVGMFMNELEKIILSIGDKKNIEPSDIEEIVGKTKEDSIFDLQRAVGQKDLEKALYYLSELLAQKEHHLALLASLASEIRFLIIAKNFIENNLKHRWNPKISEDVFKKTIYFPVILPKKREITEKSKLNIFNRPLNVLFELFKNSENYTNDELVEAMRILADLDFKMKTLRSSPVLVLEEALLRICRRSDC